MYDIAIIGLGPAGSTLARLLDSRLRVIALDKKHADGMAGFHKPCGGLLAPVAQKSLSRLGLALPRDILVDPQLFCVRTIDVQSRLIRHYYRHFINLDRHRFDLWLKALIPAHVLVKHNTVCKNIAPISDGWRVTCMQNGQQQDFAARYVVGADGAASLIRRSLYPQDKLRKYLAIQQWFPDCDKAPFYSCIFDAAATDCYAWGVAKNEHFVFGGAFAPYGANASFTALKVKMTAFGFKLQNPFKTEACMVLRPEPFKFFTGRNGVFLVGEAAAFISPSSLQGISYALDSAVLLSKVLNSGAKDPHSAYHLKTLKMQGQLFSKNLKSPFTALRGAIMRSGLSSFSFPE